MLLLSLKKDAILTCSRYPKFRRWVHHTMLWVGRVSEVSKSPLKQVESRPCFYLETRMASQLAHFHQRDHILLPHKFIDMREQYVDFEIVIGGGFRLLGGSDDFCKDEELEDDDVCRVFVHLPTLQRSIE